VQCGAEGPAHSSYLCTYCDTSHTLPCIACVSCGCRAELPSSNTRKALLATGDAYIHTYIDAYVQTYIYTHIHTYIHRCIRTNIHTSHTFKHTYIHIYIHHIHTQYIGHRAGGVLQSIKDTTQMIGQVTHEKAIYLSSQVEEMQCVHCSCTNIIQEEEWECPLCQTSNGMCVCVCVCVCEHACMCVCVRVCEHACMYVCVFICLYFYVCIYARTCNRIYAHEMHAL
jgi:hypothetical protein